MTIERLGAVTVPSGVVMVVDTGLLNLWCDGASASTAVDFRIEGHDAEAAGRAFDRQWNPFYVFDIPSHGVEAVKKSFAEKLNGLRAALVEVARVPHRERVDLALKVGGGRGEVQFHGVPGVVISGLPKNREFPVLGERLEDGRWRWVALEVRDGAKVHRFVDAGTVAVDWARLMFVDVDALGSWRHHEAVDDKADVVFWGRDAEIVAEKFGAERIGGSEFGWKDLHVDLAIDRGQRIEALKAEGALKFAVDFRPHSDHYRLLQPMRASQTESGTITLGNSVTCGFFTTWGDGFFPVRVGLDENDEVVRVQIDFTNLE